MAILGKVFVDEVEKHTGNIVPLVELPGANEIVETLKKTTNSGLKIAAIDSLIYINRPEYKDDISTILKIVTNDTNPYVAQTAEEALEKIQ